MSFLPGFWLAFSLTYSRGNYREFLAKWRIVLVAAFLLPIGVALGFRQHLLHLLPPTGADEGWSLSFGSAGKALNVLCLIGAVMVVSNLEKTFRSTVGTMRWRIKFVILALAVIFAGRIYTLSQSLLYSVYDLTLTDVESGALLIGCALMSIGYLRNGLAEIDVYPSPSLLQGTITVLLAGGYLFFIGLLAQVIALLGGAGSFRMQALLVLVGMACLAVLLLSERNRQRVKRFVSRHFKRPQHDFRKVWLLFTQRMSGVLDRDSVCSIAAKIISETFNVLSVTIWRVDERKGKLVFGASTALTARDAVGGTALPLEAPRRRRPAGSRCHSTWRGEGGMDRKPAKGHRSTISDGGNRICVPLSGRRPWLGCGFWQIVSMDSLTRSKNSISSSASGTRLPPPC